ncbi:MAG: hypothetical protein ACI4S4_03395, partial [Candidatus Ornithospirochaeta sp.]
APSTLKKEESASYPVTAEEDKEEEKAEEEPSGVEMEIPETDEKKEEEVPQNEETEETKAEEKEEELLALSECLEDDLTQEEKVKITSYIPSFFFLEEPLVVESVTLTVCEKRTMMEIKVLNVSPSDFFQSSWSVNGTKTFVSSVPLFSGKEAEIKAMINVPTDRVDIALLSLDGNKVERKTIAPLPERKSLSSLSSDDKFPYFLSDYAKFDGKRISWAYSENVTQSAWLCPRCGSPSIGDKCTACSMEKEAALRFSPSIVLEEYAKTREGGEK